MSSEQISALVVLPSMHGESLWRSQLSRSLLSTARALGLAFPDDDTPDWLLALALSIGRRVESMAPPVWLVAGEDTAAGETLWRCTGCGLLSLSPDEHHECPPPTNRPSGPHAAIEARIMSEAAIEIHNRMIDRLDALPWWRIGLRRGLSLALLDPGGAIFEWENDAKRLAMNPRANSEAP